MCGIAGFELASRAHEHIGRRLLAELGHRGPDGGWFVTRGGYGLAQTRLAVIDLSPNVTYPMVNETGSIWLLFNGEIYDHESLRSRLERAGHRFRTRCDAEVVVHAYEEWGIESFERLDGMFALALLDERTAELVLTRDPLGIKPLVHTTDGVFAFSSDVLSLVAAGLSDGHADVEALEEYAAFHYVPMPGTGVARIAQVEPGTALIRTPNGTVRSERWRRRPFAGADGAGRPAATHDLREQTARAFDQSVRRQLVADVPVGVLLSSGVDSSLVLDSAVRAGARPVAFTVGFPGHGDFDEAGVARRFAQELNVRHVTHELRLEFADAIAGVRAAYDQPLADASALATLAVARIAREEVTVALTGTGGDDLFAGYYRHRAHLLLPLVQRAGSLMRALGAERRGDERRSTLRLMRSYLARLAVAGGDGPVGQYLSLAGPAHASQLVALLAGQRISTVAGGDPGEHPQERVARRLGLLEAADRSETILAAIQQFETQTYLASDLLAKEDRATMAVGLEARVPMLGRELLLLAESLGDSELISVRAGKRPLRALAANRLPRFLTRRRKRGFAVPIAALLSGPWREPAVAWLRGSTSRLLDAGLVANGIEHGRLHPETAWAACALVAWESRLEDARADARHYDPR